MTINHAGHIVERSNRAAEQNRDITLSVLIPFYKDDPTPLATALNTLAGKHRSVEVLMFDDGCPDARLNAMVTRTINALSIPARLLTCDTNVGRSTGRNILADRARGRWLLYLDADMKPGDESFVDAYLERLSEDDFDAAFGGYETANTENPAHQVHAALAQASDEKDAAARDAIGPTAFCSSNLLVRAAVMRDVRFDDGFTGWGWEDVDWAVRAARAYRLIHVDNPALHSGLQPTDSLLSKYRSGAVNYARLLEKHPQLSALPGARAARTLGAVPFQKLFRGVWSTLARHDGLPMKLRTTALKLWRASWTAEAI